MRELAFRYHPRSPGGNYREYTAEELKNPEKVESLFDLCQILEAYITADGWHFLIAQHGFQRLYEIDKKSGWFDEDTLEEFVTYICGQIEDAEVLREKDKAEFETLELQFTPEMLRDVDVLVYDIQDNGCRSYTYISTLGMLMEACADQGKELVVLDRPNPLGGRKIEGCIAEEGYISFVSQYNIPYLYAQTPGELALMVNEEARERWEADSAKVLADSLSMKKNGVLYKPCCLTVVPMEGWHRDMLWEDTGLEWVVASPHVQTGRTAYFYPMTGILGEFGFFNIGVGYTLPFELLGAAWIDAQQLADSMNALNLPGLIFRPIYYKPFYSVYKGEQIQGVQIHLMDFNAAHLTSVQFHLLEMLNRLYPEHRFFEECDPKRFHMFDIVCGTGFVREQFAKTYRWADLEEYWNKDVDAYRARSSKYYLYE